MKLLKLDLKQIKFKKFRFFEREREKKNECIMIYTPMQYTFLVDNYINYLLKMFTLFDSK